MKGMVQKETTGRNAFVTVSSYEATAFLHYVSMLCMQTMSPFGFSSNMAIFCKESTTFVISLF